MPLRSFTFRLVITAAAVFVTTLLPLYLVLNSQMDESAKNYAIITITITNVIIVVFATMLHYSALIEPLKKINNIAEKISGGNFNTRIDFKPFDSNLAKLTLSFNKMADEFENLEQMRKSFVANASHELRSPLTSMQGFLQAILDGTIPPEDSKKYLEIVFNETKRLSYMINSMLDLSRMESGKSPLNLTRFELNELIRRVIIRFEPSLIRKALQLDLDFASDQCFVFADKDKIEQVVVNLVDNAIKYSPNSSKIYVSIHLHQRKVYVSIKDRGYGIAKKDQQFIWDRFYMTDKARTPIKEKGTGLGLSIVKRIIDEHGEVVWVESSKGQGSTFIFTLQLFDATKHKLLTTQSVEKQATKR